MSRARALIPLVLVLVAVLFNLWTLRAETMPAQNLNDGAMHASMIRWAEHEFEAGRIPLDGWYPYLSLGLPQFHHYQSFGHLLTGYVATFIGSERAYTWTLYLLLSLWPLSIYWGARLLGWDRWISAIAGLVSPLLVSASGYGYEYGSYTWQGLGEWAQLWGMWFLPLALGVSWRTISRGKGYAASAVVIALAFASNFLTGYQAFLSLGIWVVIKPSQILRRLGRAAILAVGAVLTGAWVFVPLLVDREWANRSAYLVGVFRDSFGAPRVLRWLGTGEIYDHGRLPVLTVLVAAGLLFCILNFRRDERARALLVLWTMGLVLFFGPLTLGPLVNVLPGGRDLLFLPFITGLHLAGILLAGVGGVWLGRTASAFFGRFLPSLKTAVTATAIAVVGFGFLLPAWTERNAFTSTGAGLIRDQQFADVNDGANLGYLIDAAKTLGGGRIYSGNAANWGRQYAVGFVPVYSALLNHDAEGVGWTFRTIFSLSHDIEVQFNETNPAHYNLLDVKYLILPSARTPPVSATRLESRGRHVLWQVKTNGYIELVDTIGAITADRTNLGSQMASFLQSLLSAQNLYPTVTFAGVPAEDGAAAFGQVRLGSPGRVEHEFNLPSEGFFSAQVTADRRATVLLKSSYHPRWSVIVDGVRQRPQMIAPSFVGGAIGPGKHTVVFRYEPYLHYPFLFALGAITLICLTLLSRRGGRARLGRGDARGESGV